MVHRLVVLDIGLAMMGGRAPSTVWAGYPSGRVVFASDGDGAGAIDGKPDWSG